MQIECPFCQNKIKVEPELIGHNTKCLSCNREFTIKNPNLMPCPDCFAIISKHALFCPHCGASVNSLPNWNTKETNESINIDNEQEILVFNPSALNYLGLIIIGIITCVFIIGFFILIGVWLEVHNTVYKITNLRIIVKKGWIAKAQNEIWIKDMRAANLSQGLLQRICNIGDISIGTAATAGTEIYLNGINDPQKVVDTINLLRK